MVPQLTEQIIGGPPFKRNYSGKDFIVSFHGDTIYDITESFVSLFYFLDTIKYIYLQDREIQNVHRINRE